MHSARHRRVRLTKARVIVAATAAVVCVPIALVAGSAVSAHSSQPTRHKSSGDQLHGVPAPTKAIVTKLTKLTQSRSTPHRLTQRAEPRLDPNLATSGPGSVAITLRGDVAQGQAAVKRLGGKVVASVSGALNAVVPKTQLTTLAASPGVIALQQPVKAVVTSAATTQGVVNSNASAWQAAVPARTGAGVTIGIVDAGFKNLAAEVAAGHLPANQGVENIDPSNGGCTHDTTHANDPNLDQQDASEHGTAVAEIVHQMAPAATLKLYCIVDTVGFATAEQLVEASLSTSNPIKVVTSSLGFPGDGTSSSNLAAYSMSGNTVNRASSHGVLWIQSAGNNGQDHWGGTLTDSNGDGVVEMSGVDNPDDYIRVLAQGTATALLTWNGWPTSTAPVNLTAFTCPLSSCTNASQLTQVPGTRCDGSGAPCISVTITNNTSSDQVWGFEIGTSSTVPAVRYDISYWGDVSASYLSTVNAARAASGSVTEPADATGAFAVGAADESDNTLEPYSSQGPTSDNRTKPDILGVDCVNSYLDEFSGPDGFCGTSAAAPHVAGAAALVLGFVPTLSASQIRSYLQQHAGTVPQNNAVGSGLLKLPPTGAGFKALAAPLRVRDTRAGRGASLGPVGSVKAGHVIVADVSSAVPPTATAVAINLTGTATTSAGFLSALPGDGYSNGQAMARPSVSTLNTSVTDPTTAVFAIVAVSSQRKIAVYNSGGTADVIVDVLGYFSPGETGHYGALATSYRALDTRGSGGAMGNRASRSVFAGVPAGATAAVINVTATGQASDGYLSVAPTCPPGGLVTTSTLNYLNNRPTRANMAIVGLSPNGSFCVTDGGGPVQAVVDVVGYISPNATANYDALATPVREFDTRPSSGGSGPLGQNGTLTARIGDLQGVPATATAVAGSFVATDTTAASFLTVYPAGSARPIASTVNFGANQTVPNAAVANLGTGAAITVYNQGGRVNVILDVSGYFT